MFNIKNHTSFFSIKRAILLFCFFCPPDLFAQKYSNTRRVLTQIKSVPDWYSMSEQTGKKDFSKIDSSYREVVKLDTNAIVKLMDLLPDTTSTKIINTCGCGFFTFGQLAFFLINDIENIPLKEVLTVKWLPISKCNSLPYGFLNYLKDNGKDFENKYREYFNSRKRLVFLIGKAKA